MHKVLFWFDVEEDADAAGGEEVLDGLLLELVPFKLLVDMCTSDKVPSE